MVHPPQGSRAQADIVAKGVNLKFARIMTASGSCLIRLIQVPGIDHVIPRGFFFREGYLLSLSRAASRF